jgi:hypothetical protein
VNSGIAEFPFVAISDRFFPELRKWINFPVWVTGQVSRLGRDGAEEARLPEHAFNLRLAPGH